MPYKKKTWQEKLEGKKDDTYPKTLQLNPKFPCGPALKKMGAKDNDTVVITPMKDVNNIMKTIPKGYVITLKEICQKLAKKHLTFPGGAPSK
jgi:hypothetical protein